MPAAELAKRLESARALIFDWDGVFNAGAKGEAAPSTFNEADSMGTNLLRFALWRRNGALPATAVVTGEENATARRFALRERFHAVYQAVRYKPDALERFCASHGLDGSEVVCVFDDVNDLGLAERCGVRAFVRRPANPLLQRFVERRGLCDYVTAAPPGGNAVREVAELVLGLLGVFDSTAESRMRFDEDYTRYFAARQSIATAVVDFREARPGG